MGRPSASPLAPEFLACVEAFDAEFDYVYRTLRRHGVQPSEAEDLAQDVFVVLWRRWREYHKDRPLRPWLVGIAHRVALAHLRRYGRQQAVEDIDALDETLGPDDQLASARARQLVLRALARLPEAQRAILVKHDLDGTPIREIADELSVPMFTAAARLRRARIRFAKAVQQIQKGRPPGRPALWLPASVLLERERDLPRVSPQLRQRMRRRLPAGPELVGPAAPVLAPVPRGPLPPLPISLAIVGLVAVGIVLLSLSSLRGRPVGGEATIDHAAGPAPAPRRKLPPPRLAAPPAARGVTLAAMFAAAPAATGHHLRRGLVAHWGFEEEPGSAVARDLSGHGRTCVLRDVDAAAAWTEAGAVGRALDLRGGGWLECPMPEGRAGVPIEISAAAWIKRAAQARTRAAVVFTRPHPGNVTLPHLFWVGVYNDQLSVSSGAWQGWAAIPARSLEPWTHVAFTHAGNVTRLYVDGALQTTRYHPPRGAGVARGPLVIGAHPDRANAHLMQGHLRGLVDEVMIYDRRLSDAEVADLAGR